MKRRELLSAAALFASLPAIGIRTAQERRQTNLLVICIDDLNSWVNSLAPEQLVLTPWIDRLASQGTLFEKAYCAAPYCNASRMAVFTGCWPFTTGIYKDEPYWRNPQRKPTFIEAIRKEGYKVFSAGKVFHGKYDYDSAKEISSEIARWVNQEDRPWLWDERVAVQPEPLPSPFPTNGIKRDWIGNRWSPHFDWGVLSAEQEAMHPDVITAKAVSDFLGKPQPKPFLAIAGFYKPHLPWYAPQRWLSRYSLDSSLLPTQRIDDLNDVPSTARLWAEKPPDEATLAKEGKREEAVKAYKASISFVDEQIGQVLQALWTSPHARNTVIALWSDNGFHLGEKLHWRKFTLWEEATRVPMIIVDQHGGPYKSRVTTPVSLIDLFPTLFDLAGLPPIDKVDGHSLKALMQGERSEAETPVVMTWGAGNHSIRQGAWRYTQYLNGGEELYNHAIDPHEHQNLSEKYTVRQQQRHLRHQLAQALKQTGP